MSLFYFVGGPVAGQEEAFFRRLTEVGGSPATWRIYPHARGDGQALHVVEADGAAAIEAHLATFVPIYRRGPIIEIAVQPA